MALSFLAISILAYIRFQIKRVHANLWHYMIMLQQCLQNVITTILTRKLRGGKRTKRVHDYIWNNVKILKQYACNTINQLFRDNVVIETQVLRRSTRNRRPPQRYGN